METAIPELEAAVAAPPPAMTLDEVAAALQISITTFYAKRGALEAGGFPRKLPGVNRWSRRAVTTWIENGGYQS